MRQLDQSQLDEILLCMNIANGNKDIFKKSLLERLGPIQLANPDGEDFERMSMVDKLQLITDHMGVKLNKHIDVMRTRNINRESAEYYYFSIIDIYCNRAKNVFPSIPGVFEEHGAASLKIAALAKKMLATKWYQWGKRSRIEREINEISKKHNIKY